jgi:aldehyde:ferredoxin oxidoreductase
LTGILGASNIGGYVGAWLRSCNIVSIIITGRSSRPTYLYIDEAGAHFKDAASLWGKDCFDVQDRIREIHKDERIKILTIGPAGENRVSFAAVMSDRDHAAGRTGMGSVMGSKNLKAIVISKGAHQHLRAVTPIQKTAVKTYAQQIRSAPEFAFFSKFGGSGYLEWANEFGIMGSKNYGRIGADQVEQIDGRRLEKNIVRSSGCFRCPVQCKADLKMRVQGRDENFTRPEFEPMINLGPKCGLDDLEKIVHLDNLCNRLGMDSTSAATVIAFAMDLFERGVLSADQAGGLDLAWGNADTMETLLFQMVEGRGLGKILRLGVQKAAEVIGNGSSRYAAHVKGLELTAYHPSAIMGTALGYAVSSRGGDYNNVYASLEYSWTQDQAEKEFGTKEAVDIHSITAKGRVIKKAVITNIIVDSLGLCKVPVLSLLRDFNLENEVELLRGLAGLDLSKEDLERAGEKIAALEKLFNLRHERGNCEDTLPEMFFKEDNGGRDTGDTNGKGNGAGSTDAENSGKAAKKRGRGLTRQNLEIMLKEYYIAMGWDENGIPPEVIKEPKILFNWRKDK